MNVLILAAFCILLITCILCNISIVFALFAGLLLFCLYGKMCQFNGKELFSMCLEGIQKSKTILITFLLIGILTGLWRACGCIPSIICYASGLIHPKAMILLTFLLCSLVSFLTGTAFGTAATMGVICMSIAQSMNLPPSYIGGAMLSGCYFGDRCSPVSTSALLVSTLTETDIYENIKNMAKSALWPFALTCILYTALGLRFQIDGANPGIRSLFEKEFVISPLCLLPAAAIFIFALFRLKVQRLMLISIGISVPVALFLQKSSIPALLYSMALGYKAETMQLSYIINGGGILSMLKVAAIILIASCYAGIFEKTGLLEFLQMPIEKAAGKTGSYPVTLTASALLAGLTCNQTLSIILTHQLTAKLEEDQSRYALDLENSAVVIAPLIPWTISATVPLDAIGGPLSSIPFAFYLLLLILFSLVLRRK